VEYARQRGEMKQLKDSVDTVKDQMADLWLQARDSYPFENPYPIEDDFVIVTEPDVQPGQPEFQGEGFKGEPVEKFDQEGYDAAMQAYLEEEEEAAKYFEGFEFVEAIDHAIARSERSEEAGHERAEEKKREESMEKALERARSESPSAEGLMGDEGVFASWYGNHLLGRS
jgi:hypothetical protein